MSNTYSGIKATVRAVAAPLAWSAYIVVPAAGWGWVDGLPLGWIEAAALALVWWVWAAARRLPAAHLQIALAVAKLALGGLLVDRGFAARYYANDAWMPPAERSIEFRGEPFTRRDERLAFDTDAGARLPLHFFNENRFNFYLPEHPQRERLAYSVEWTGFLRIDADSAERHFYIDVGPGISSSLAIDDRPLIALDSASPRSASARLENGWHAVVVSVKAPYGASRRIEAGEIIDGTRYPFEGDRVYVQPAGSVRLALDGALRWATRLTDGVLLSVLAWLALRYLRHGNGRRIAALLWLGGLGEAIVFATRYRGLEVLGGGQDWLAYESFARSIALGDVIGAGQNGPFYFQALYPYFLALTHVVFGEDLFGPVLAQRVLLVATIGWMAITTKALFGTRAAWIAALVGGMFLYAKGSRWTGVLLSEGLFSPLIVAWTTLLVKTALGQPSPSRVMAAGLIGGVATLTRTTLLLAWAPMLLLWRASLHDRRKRILVALVSTMLVVLALLPLRNWIVTGRFVPLPMSFAVNVHLGNTPTRPLDPAPPARQQIYDRLALQPQVRTVSEFVIQAPDEFARGLVNKALYVVGLFGWSGLPGESGISRWYVGTWLLAILGAIWIVCASLTSSPAVWLPAAGALSHAVALVAIFPHGYTDRLIFPLYPLLIPYAAYAVDSLLRLAPRAAVRLRLLLTPAGSQVRDWTGRYVMPRVRPMLRRRRNWLYLAYTVAAALSPEPGSALLVPAAAVAVGRLTVHEWTHRVVGGALWGLAVARVAAAGSQSAAALTDPLFWALLAVVALGASAATGRWPAAAAATAALAGVFAVVATVLPLFPAFESDFPGVNLATSSESTASLTREFGPIGALCLIALWVQAIVTGGWRSTSGRFAWTARGALLTSLVFMFAGAVPGVAVDARLWSLVFGMLAGLIEAKAQQAHPRT